MKDGISLTGLFTGALLLAVFSGCGGEPSDAGLFSDVTRELGIDFSMVNGAAGERFVNETMVGGEAGLTTMEMDGWTSILPVGTRPRSTRKSPARRKIACTGISQELVLKM